MRIIREIAKLRVAGEIGGAFVAGGVPFRMVDTDYSFDVMLPGISSLEELESAIDKARAN